MAHQLVADQNMAAHSDGRIVVTCCRDCGAQFAFPTPSCFSCGSVDLAVEELAGSGRVFSWTVSHLSFGAEIDAPYTVLLVELEGGARIYGRLLEEWRREALRAGMSVTLDADETRSRGHAVFSIDKASCVERDFGEGQAPAKTCYEVVREVSLSRGAHPAFQIVDHDSLSFTELVARIDACAAMLAANGLKAGDRLAVMSNNRSEVLELWLACSRLGAVFVPFNPALRGPILRDMLELADTRLGVAEPEWCERLKEAGFVGPIVELSEFGGDSRTHWGEHDDAGEVAGDPAALSIIMFTSGTTGRSKGVMWSSLTINGMAVSIARNMEFGDDDRLHTALPMFHGNALVLTIFAALMAGGTAVVSRKFSASGFAGELERSQATATSFLGSMTNMVLSRTPDRPFSGTLRKALVIPAPPAVAEALAARFGCQVASAYGLADAGLPLFTGLAFPSGTCGRAYDPFWEARVVDDEGREVPRGTVGELAVRPRQPGLAAMGYWRMSEATRATQREGWYHTGDLMRQDTEGWFTFMDRHKDMIRRRGENVSSQELESVFESHPHVLECAAYPVPSDMAEDEIMLAVVRTEGSDVQALDLVRFAEPQLPYFAMPRFVRFVEKLPKNALEKVLKADLRREGIVEEAWDLNASGYSIQR